MLYELLWRVIRSAARATVCVQKRKSWTRRIINGLENSIDAVTLIVIRCIDKDYTDALGVNHYYT